MRKNIGKLALIAFVASFLFVFLPVQKTQATGCQITINFDAEPKLSAYNQNIKLTLSFTVAGFEPTETNGGYCLDQDGNAVKSVQVQFRGDTFIINPNVVALKPSNPGPYSVSATFKPSDYKKKQGDKFSITALVSGTTVAFTLAQSSPVAIALTAGAFNTWGCVAGNNVYACSPGNLNNCSDVPNGACQGKPCVQFDNRLCGLPSANSHKGCLANACKSIFGSGRDTCDKDSDCSPTPTTSKTASGSNQFEIPNPIGINTFEDLIGIIGQWIFNLAIPVAVIIIIYAGIRMLASRGVPAEFEAGKKALKWAIIGLAIVLIGKGFVSLIQSILSLKNG